MYAILFKQLFWNKYHLKSENVSLLCSKLGSVRLNAIYATDQPLFIVKSYDVKRFIL